MREATTICLRPLQVDLWPFDLESGVWVTSVLDLGPDVHDRQIRHSSSLNASALWERVHNNQSMKVRAVGTRYIATFTHVVQSRLSVGAVNNIAQEFFGTFLCLCVGSLCWFWHWFVCVCAQFCVYIWTFFLATILSVCLHSCFYIPSLSLYFNIK